MYYVVKRNWCHHTKYTRHQKQLHFSKVVIKRKIRQYQETMGDNFQNLHAITARKQDIMRGIAHHQ